MARKAGFFLKLVIFVICFFLGYVIFSNSGMGKGQVSGFLGIGDAILGSDLSSQGGSIAGMIVSFIITAGIYWLAAEIITWVLVKLFGRDEKE